MTSSVKPSAGNFDVLAHLRMLWSFRMLERSRCLGRTLLSEPSRDQANLQDVADILKLASQSERDKAVDDAETALGEMLDAIALVATDEAQALVVIGAAETWANAMVQAAFAVGRK